MSEDRHYRVKMIFHPTLHVLDLSEAEQFFQRVFGVPSISIASIFAASGSAPSGFPTDYSTFSLVREVLFDSLDPKKFVIDGVQRYRDIERPHLKTLGWYVENAGKLFTELKRRGIRVTTTKDEIIESDEPTSPFHGLPEDTGIRYHFFAPFEYLGDPRSLVPGWSLPPVSPDDPLGLVHCNRHTILTDRLDRALNLVVDILGGTVISAGRDELRGLTSTYVHLGDAVLEYAAPDPGTAAAADLAANGPNDAYHAITWQVLDLAKAEQHLAAKGIAVQARSEDTIITDPATGLGIPWGFTTTPVPGDAR